MLFQSEHQNLILFRDKKPVNLFKILQREFAYTGFQDLFVCMISRLSCLNDFHLSSLLIDSAIIVIITSHSVIFYNISNV